MGSYYYLTSQLPHLIYGQKPPMSSSSFKELAVSLLNEDDAALMAHLNIDPEPVNEKSDGPAYADNPVSTGCGFIDDWRNWERALRLNYARHRAIKLKRESDAPIEPPLFPSDAHSVAVKAVVGTPSPLDAEILIDKARWNEIEVLAGNDYFDRNTVFAYYLKLILLERKNSFNTEEGFAEYKSLYASILKSAQNSHSTGESS